jgi:hypothetical protein
MAFVRNAAKKIPSKATHFARKISRKKRITGEKNFEPGGHYHEAPGEDIEANGSKRHANT